MTDADKILEAMEVLPPEGKRELLDFAEFLVVRYGDKGPLRSTRGLWADLGIDLNEQDIDDARKEMWGSFPREDVL